MSRKKLKNCSETPNSSFTFETKKNDPTYWLAELSHELRLPIANIRLLVETLLDGALEDKEVCQRMLRRAYQEVERLQNLVLSLLAQEEVIAKRHGLKCKWTLLEPAATYAAETVAVSALAKNIKVELLIKPGFLVFANPEQLDQVLLNLVENAVKFTGFGGGVWIKSGSYEGSFSVVDTGIGIPESEIPKIFQRFYRVDKSKSKGSTGLGLSIVKHIVDLHGARISVSANVGSGSIFKVEFPGPGQVPSTEKLEKT